MKVLGKAILAIGIVCLIAALVVKFGGSMFGDIAPWAKVAFGCIIGLIIVVALISHFRPPTSGAAGATTTATSGSGWVGGLVCLVIGVVLFMSAAWVSGTTNLAEVAVRIIGLCLIGIGVVTLLRKMGVHQSTLTVLGGIAALFYFVLIPFGKMVEHSGAEAEKAKIDGTIEKPLTDGLWTKIESTRVGKRRGQFDVASVAYYIADDPNDLPPIISELALAQNSPAFASKLRFVSRSEVGSLNLPPANFYYVTPCDGGRSGTLKLVPE